MNADIALRMLVIERSRSLALGHAAEARQAHPPKRHPFVRRIGLALIRIGESLVEPAARPARAR
jgi:hypothetical protein